MRIRGMLLPFIRYMKYHYVKITLTYIVPFMQVRFVMSAITGKTSIPLKFDRNKQYVSFQTDFLDL